MVFSVNARVDVDNELLTKTIIYKKFKNVVRDAASDEPDNTSIDDKCEHTIKAQCTVQTINSRYVSEGILTEGDLVGFLRYKYEEDANGDVISPTLIPKSKDHIKFLGQWFVIKQCTPATNEDDGVIGWDITAGQTGNNTFELDGD